MTEKDQKSQRMEHILDAVIHCWLEDNDQPQSAQVAVRAGISTRTLNRYYPDQSRLLYDALAKYITTRNGDILRCYHDLDLTGLSGRERLLRFLRALLAFYMQDLHATANYVSANLTCVYLSLKKNYNQLGFDGRVKALLAGDLETGRKDGSIRAALDPARTGAMIAANFNGLLQRIDYQLLTCSTEQATQSFSLLDDYLDMLNLYLQPREAAT